MTRAVIRPATVCWVGALLACTLTACGSGSSAGRGGTAASPGSAASTPPATSPAAPSAGSTSATAGSRPVVAPAVEQADLAMALTLYQGSAAARAAAATQAAAGTMVDHAVDGRTGAAALTSAFQAIEAKAPGARAVVKRASADSDLVAVQWQATSTPKDEMTGYDVVDLFRFAGGRIVEHWQVAQQVPATTKTGQSMFSDLYRYPGGKAPRLTEDQEEANRTRLLAACTRLFGGDFGVLDTDWSPTYLQHNPQAPNGTQGVKDAFTMMLSGGWGPAAAGADIRFPASLADGDLVWVFLPDYGSVDIFRVADGRAVEHWDVIPAFGR